MVAVTITECIDTCSDEGVSNQLRTSLDDWMQRQGTAAELFWNLRIILDGANPSPWTASWSALENVFRCESTVMTPYELSRAFGLEAEFEASDYWGRWRMANRLRLDCDFPEAELRAAEEQARLEAMSPEERQEHKRQQDEQNRRIQQMRQQMMQEQQGDPYVASVRAKARYGRPRKMLDHEQRQTLQAELQSRGVDLDSEQALSIEADDVEQAINFARLLSHVRGCDLFRGQPKDWNPVPGILRLPFEKQGSERWREFRKWARTQEPLAELAEDQKKLGAIAQHYGLPTYLLDFSRNPRVAAFFATHCDLAPGDGKACIYCVSAGALAASCHHAPGWMRYYEVLPEVECVEVNGLFRMHAQEGAFVCANQTWWTSTFRPDEILFPRQSPVPAPSAADIYPTRKSEIETLVDEYFANEPEDLKQLGS